MGKNNVRPLVSVGLRHAEKLAREKFDMPLAKHGLIGKHEYLDNTDYFTLPDAGGLGLCWYFDFQRDLPHAVLELMIDDNDASRLEWLSGKGWSYSMMGVEDERSIGPRGAEFLHAINQLLRSDFTVGAKYPVDEARVDEIVEFHAQAFLTVKGLTK